MIYFPFLVPYYSITSSFRLHVISGVCKSRMGAIRQLCCGTSSQFGLQDTLSTFQISLKTSTYDKSYSQAWIQSLRNIAAAEGFSTMQ